MNRTLNTGAKGYITKNSVPEILDEAINAIMQSDAYIESGLVRSCEEQNRPSDFLSVIGEFSPREFDVFNLLAQGLTVHKIADQLCLGRKTVANYSTQIKKNYTPPLAHIAVNMGVMSR